MPKRKFSSPIFVISGGIKRGVLFSLETKAGGKGERNGAKITKLLLVDNMSGYDVKEAV